MDILAISTALKFYRSCLPGNSPGHFNIYSCLNKHLHKAVDYHVRYTHSFHKFDPKRFSISTPQKGKPDYLWIFDPIDGVASSIQHIISDIYDVLTSIKYMVEAQ